MRNLLALAAIVCGTCVAMSSHPMWCPIPYLLALVAMVGGRP